MPSKETFCLEVEGDFACFTRPEMKVERVSYDVITPSAARAIFEAILWKPGIWWQVTKIDVLKPINWMSVRRNEVASVVSVRNVKQAMSGNNKAPSILIEHDRQQRAGLFLRDVAYRIYAHFSIKPNNTENTYVKFAEMFTRRARKGQCFNQPYLGTREFSANWQLIDSSCEKTPAFQLDQDRPLGWMLYDLFSPDSKNPVPRFFNPVLKKDGSIDVPNWGSEEVRG